MALMGWSLTNSTLIFVLNSLIRTAVRNYFFTEGGNGSVWQLTTSEKDLLGLKQQHIGRSVQEQPKLVVRKIRTWHPVCPKPVLEFFDVKFAVTPLAVKPLIYFLWGFHIHTGYDMPDISSFLVAFHFCHNRVNKRVNVFGLMKPCGTHGFPDASS